VEHPPQMFTVKIRMMLQHTRANPIVHGRSSCQCFDKDDEVQCQSEACTSCLVESYAKEVKLEAEEYEKIVDTLKHDDKIMKKKKEKWAEELFNLRHAVQAKEEVIQKVYDSCKDSVPKPADTRLLQQSRPVSECTLYCSKKLGSGCETDLCMKCLSKTYVEKALNWAKFDKEVVKLRLEDPDGPNPSMTDLDNHEWTNEDNAKDRDDYRNDLVSALDGCQAKLVQKGPAK